MDEKGKRLNFIFSEKNPRMKGEDPEKQASGSLAVRMAACVARVTEGRLPPTAHPTQASRHFVCFL